MKIFYEVNKNLCPFGRAVAWVVKIKSESAIKNLEIF
jgi:hypothetical protein